MPHHPTDQAPSPAGPCARRITLTGIVQGVGLRPQVLRLAHALGVRGKVCNQGTAVGIEAHGTAAQLAAFEARLRALQPGGARIDHCHSEALPWSGTTPTGFVISPSSQAQAGLGVAPDLATCPACTAETLLPGSRRQGYPFTACAECGPRLSVFQRPPYDRAHTTMAPFPLCPACQAEYADMGDRRFHAQAMACPTCGPRATLVCLDGGDTPALHNHEAVLATARLITEGALVLIKGIGGYQLACDATHAEALNRLRQLKQRQAKPFALLVRDVAMLARWCEVSPIAGRALASSAAPIVLLPRRQQGEAGTPPLAEGVAPGLSELGAMLPPTALHHLLMQALPHPIVLTSGNLSGEPQAITLEEALRHAHTHVRHVLDHNRAIVRRVDDSVGRVVAGAFRVMRRARGLAPAPLPLPPGFDPRPQVLALGGDLKNTFALLRDGQGVLSQHMGDLHDATCLADQQKALGDYLHFYGFRPDIVACDAHPGYAATQMAPALAGHPPVTVGHHHAHIAACLGEHRWPLDGPPVLGIALDGLGLGEASPGRAGTALWGGEFLLAHYSQAQRLGSILAVPLLGGDKAAREPWRNTYAHIMSTLGWQAFSQRHGGTPLHSFLSQQPRALLDQLMHKPHLAPPASSTGRLFDAVAAALGVCRAHSAYEGEAAMRLEALVGPHALAHNLGQAYPFGTRLDDPHSPGLPTLDPLPMWAALLDDLREGHPLADMAARFHLGLARAVVQQARQLAQAHGLRTVALGGGVFQNRHLTELVVAGLGEAGLACLLPTQLPCNDGGLAWGQALVALARHDAPGS